MRYLLALDQGTTSSRAMLFNRHGQVLAQAQRPFAQHFPQPGWVAHDATEIWQSQLAVAQECVQKARQALVKYGGLAIEKIAIGIANQRETTVLWDRLTGQPLAPAVVWQDRRTAAACDALRAQGHAPLVQQKTGLLPDAYFSATKLQWLLDHTPGARARAERGELAFGTVDSWLVWNLTGGGHGGLHATDASNASRTLLFNIHTLTWDDALLALFNIPRSVLPQVVASSGVLGETDPRWFGVPLPIAGLAGDQQAATFGQGCFAPGMAKNTYGTGCFMLMNTGTAAVPSRHQLLTTVAWVGGGNPLPRAGEGWGGGERVAAALLPSNACYALEGSVFMGGATVQWLRDGLQLVKSADEVEALAASVPDTGDVYLVPAFTGLGTPYWDGHARGTLVGLTRGTGRGHIARAALESVALQTADVFDAMARDAALPLRELRVDGGASRNDLLMQMQADFLGVPVVRPGVTETTALGAARLAGLAVGVWPGMAEMVAEAVTTADRRFEPRLAEAQRAAKLARWREAVARSRSWARPSA